MTALGDVGGVRYLVPIWPCIAVSWIFAADWVRLKVLVPRPELPRIMRPDSSARIS